MAWRKSVPLEVFWRGRWQSKISNESSTDGSFILSNSNGHCAIETNVWHLATFLRIFTFSNIQNPDKNNGGDNAK
uniref:Uncharacterized protein n=1 Tax=Rhizophora mucronata TaxID=61149 RepID=A0A2P2P5V8_RHIMU